MKGTVKIHAIVTVLLCAFSLAACQSAAAVQEERILMEAKSQKSEKTMTPAEVYREHVDAVVHIRTSSTNTDAFGRKVAVVGSGTGFIVTLNGYVVTNFHVVDGAQSVAVSLYSGETHTAQFIGGDSENDVALLKIEGEKFPYLSVGSSKDLEVGELIAAIGNPLGELTYSMTVGYVSALDRKISAGGTPINMLQTDAPINSGNSGGPVFDMSGKVIGIVSAKYSGRSQSGAYIEGLGFAIPIDDVLGILRDISR